jgi:hypothetical protein
MEVFQAIFVIETGQEATAKKQNIAVLGIGVDREYVKERLHHSYLLQYR